MKIKDGLEVREVAGKKVVLPLNKDLDLNMMISLNGTGAFLWKILEKDTEIPEMAQALADEYEIDLDKATEGVIKFVEKLKKNDFLE